MQGRLRVKPCDCDYGFLPGIYVCQKCHGTGKVLVFEEAERPSMAHLFAWALLVGAAIAVLIGVAFR